MLALSAPFRSGGDAAGLPQRLRILKWGENIARPSGKVIVVDDTVAETLSANQELVGIDRVPMDYEHQSFKGHKNYQPDPRQHPGFGHIEVVPGEGVFLSAIEYTPSGVEHAASYQDVSAVVHLDDKNRPLWISAVALTQYGSVADVEFADAVAALSLTEPDQTTKPTMDPYKPLLLKLLGLADDASDEAIHAAAEKKADAPAAASTEALSARLELIEKGEEKRARLHLVERATSEGKVIPLSAELMGETPLKVLEAIIDKLPAGTVALST